MKKGFSLIELLISLIIISIITAAFAPVISKRIISRSASILVAKDCKTIDHCESYDSSCNCTGCAEGYEINGGICVEKKNYTEAECLTATGLKICIAKYNAGDANGLSINNISDTTIKAAGSTSGASGMLSDLLCCWQGTTGGTCTAVSSYSPYTRTVCTWGAANKICEYHG